MATITDNINRIKQAKSDIKEAIISKGVEVADDVRIDGYAEKIGEIQQGGGGSQFAIDFGEEIYTNNSYSMNAEQEDIDYYNQIQAERAAYAAGTGGRSDDEIFKDPEFKRKIAWWPKGMRFPYSLSNYTNLRYIDASLVNIQGRVDNFVRHCISLSIVDNLSLDKATIITNFFAYSGIKQAKYSLQSATDITSVFLYCQALKSVKLTSTSNIELYSNAFNNCLNIRDISIDDMSAATKTANMIVYCSSIEKLRLGKVGIALSCTSPVLSPESIAYILRNRLKGKAWKLTLNATAKANFLAKVDDGSVYEERDDNGEIVHTSTYAEIYTEAQSEVTLA